MDICNPEMHKFFNENGGKTFPKEHLEIASRQLDEFCKMLELEGVTVRRPDHIDHSFEYETPDFKSTGKSTTCIWLNTIIGTELKNQNTGNNQILCLQKLHSPEFLLISLVNKQKINFSETLAYYAGIHPKVQTQLELLFLPASTQLIPKLWITACTVDCYFMFAKQD